MRKEITLCTGRDRTRDGQQAVDARAEWNGRAFDGPAGFKTAAAQDGYRFSAIIRGIVESYPFRNVREN